MKILLVNVVYNKGSTGEICTNLFNYFLTKGHDAYFAYGRGKKEKKAYKFCFELESKFFHFLSKFTGNFYGGMFLSTFRLIRYIKKNRPDVVNLHCINGFCVNIYKLLNFLKKNNINTVISHHAEFLYTGTCGYSRDCNQFKTECKKCPLNFCGVYRNFKKMEKAFKCEKFKHITVSPWVEKRLKESSILRKAKVKTIFNPVVASKIALNPYNTENNILFATSDFNNVEKGGTKLYEIAKLLPQFNFYVAGEVADSKINNIHFLGKLKKSDLANYYYFSNCSIILSLRETFSMVVAESLCYGTPVVGFKAGAPETIALHNYSTFVSQNDYKSFCDAVIKFVDSEIDKDVISNEARKLYSLESCGDAYLKYYEE